MAKTTKKDAGVAKTPEVLEPESPDLKMVETDGTTIGTFLRNLVGFMREATMLEQKAKATYLQAKQLKPPTNVEEDSAIQTFIKNATADKKAVEAHWSICSTFSQVHRRLTAARGRATEPLEGAQALAQRLHNDYAEAERRRAAEEQERVRQAAELRARQEREAEAARLEQDAVQKEMASADLSARELLFVDYVVTQHLDAGAAARLAGYKDYEKQGQRLMSAAKIQTALQAKRDAIAIREQAQATREKPLDIRVETVKPQVGKAAGGSFDRTTHSAELLNERLFIEAIVGGQHGIPLDVLTVNTAKLNEYARSLQERINLWPGVRHKKTTRTV